MPQNKKTGYWMINKEWVGASFFLQINTLYVNVFVCEGVFGWSLLVVIEGNSAEDQHSFGLVYFYTNIYTGGKKGHIKNYEVYVICDAKGFCTFYIEILFL